MSQHTTHSNDRATKKALVTSILIGLLFLPLKLGFSQTSSGPDSYGVTDRGGVSMISPGNSLAMKVGYARIRPDPGKSTPSGLAIFGFRQNGVLVSEAGVPGSAALQSARIYTEINGPVNTGLAIANPNAQEAIVSFFFSGPNGNLASGTTRIPANGQIAAFLDQAPFRGPSPFTGTFTLESSVPVAVIAIRGFLNERNEFLITTLPVTDLRTPARTGPMVFPHFADGGGWTTQVVLVNPTDAVMNGTVQFLDQSGNPVGVVIDGQLSTSFGYSIPARNSQKLRSAGTSSSIVVGSVRVTSSSGAAPDGLAIFAFRSGGFTVAEAGVPATPAGIAFRLYIEAAGTLGYPGSIQTGFAVTNTSSSNATVNVEVYRLDGSSTGLTGTMVIPANGQRSTFLSQVDGLGSLGMPFQGILRVSSTQPIAVTGLRGRYNERQDFLITTTPASNEAAPSSSVDMYFPHIADSGGYTTQFILFSGQPGQSSTGSMNFRAQSGETWALSTNPAGPGQAPPARISGMVAAGSPVAGIVKVLGANGATASTTINADGSYGLDVSGLTTPYILFASGTAGQEDIAMYSAGAGPAINITPITDFIVRKAAGGPAEAAWSKWTTAPIDAAQLAAAASNVRDQLGPVLRAAGLPANAGLMTDPFATNHTGMDLVLESVDIGYDRTGNVATVTNNLTGSSYTDNLTSQADDRSGLPETDLGGTQQALSDRDAIFAGFEALGNLYAVHEPTAAELTAWFDRYTANDFLDDQKTRTEMLNRWLGGDAPPVGLRITISILNPIEVAGTSYIRGYAVRGLGSYQGEVVDVFDTQFVYDGTRWLWWGNQTWVDMRVHPAALKNVAPNGAVTLLTGLAVTLSEGVAYERGVRSAIVSGPVLPAGGVILEHTLIPEPQFAAKGGVTSFWLDDNQIALIPDNAKYKVCLYREDATVVSPANTPLRCDEKLVPKPPLRNAELTDSMFPTLMTPGSHDGSVIVVPGLVEVAWANPANWQVDYIYLGYSDPKRTTFFSVRAGVEPGKTKGTVDGRTIPAGSHVYTLDLGGNDRYGRSFDFWWSFN